MILHDDERKDLAMYIKQCEIDKRNLKSTELAFNECTDTNNLGQGWWQHPLGVVLIGVIGVGVGIGIGITVEKL